MKTLTNIEPAAIVAFVATLFPIALVLGWDIPPGAEDATLVAIPAIAGAVTAALTRPMKVPAMVYGLQAVLMALIAWKVTIDPQFPELISATLLALGGLVTRSQVIPNPGVVDPEVVAA